MKFNDRKVTRRDFLRTTSSLLPFVVLPAGYAFGRTGQQYVHRTIYAMGTLVSIQAYGDDLRRIHNAINKAFSELRRLDALLSVFQPSSEISVINAYAGVKTVTVSTETMDVMQHAVRYSDSTNAVFDCTVGSLMQLWGFRDSTTTPSHPPSDKEIKRVWVGVG